MCINAMSTVLLVDDDHGDLWALQLAFESGGHHVVLAESGREALHKLLRVVPRLMVTDWQMPEMDGAEFCRRVRCQPMFADLPIVMLSATPEPANDPPCWSAFFRKPADLSVSCTRWTRLLRTGSRTVHGPANGRTLNRRGGRCSTRDVGRRSSRGLRA
jgi:CheY-like chemotaxis protein